VCVIDCMSQSKEKIKLELLKLALQMSLLVDFRGKHYG